MRQFIYTKENKNNKRSSGIKVTAQVYEIKENKLNYIGEIIWNTASFKGEKSTIMNFLQKKELVITSSSYYGQAESEVFEITLV